MKRTKPADKRSPSNLNAAQRAARAASVTRASPPRPAEFFAAARELADRLGLDIYDILDTHDERSAIREWDGGMSRIEAERAGWADTVDIYERQRRLAV